MDDFMDDAFDGFDNDFSPRRKRKAFDLSSQMGMLMQTMMDDDDDDDDEATSGVDNVDSVPRRPRVREFKKRRTDSPFDSFWHKEYLVNLVRDSFFENDFRSTFRLPYDAFLALRDEIVQHDDFKR